MNSVYARLVVSTGMLVMQAQGGAFWCTRCCNTPVNDTTQNPERPCAGLSTLELCRQFPEAHSLTGVDLSPHFLAVARVTQRRRGAPSLGFRVSHSCGLSSQSSSRIHAGACAWHCGSDRGLLASATWLPVQGLVGGFRVHAPACCGMLAACGPKQGCLCIDVFYWEDIHERASVLTLLL